MLEWRPTAGRRTTNALIPNVVNKAVNAEDHTTFCDIEEPVYRINKARYAHTHTHTERERERERHKEYHFDSLMEQILVNFSKEVNLKRDKAWAITLRNIQINKK